MSLSKIEKFSFFESGNYVKATRRLPHSYKKSRKPLKTKAFGVVGWRPREDLNLRPHA